jgi:hypothetical protein
MLRFDTDDFEDEIGCTTSFDSSSIIDLLSFSKGGMLTFLPATSVPTVIDFLIGIGSIWLSGSVEL